MALGNLNLKYLLLSSTDGDLVLKALQWSHQQQRLTVRTLFCISSSPG